MANFVDFDQELPHTFYEDDGKRSSEMEVLVCSLVMAHSSGAMVDTEGLLGWSRSFSTDVLGSCELDHQNHVIRNENRDEIRGGREKFR